MDDQAGLEGEPRTRARWLGVLLILVALGAAVWQAWLADHAAEPPPASPPLTAGANPSLVEMLAGIDTERLGRQGASSAAAAAAIAPAAPSAPLAPGEAELCGVGRVPADDSGQPKNMAPVQLAAQRARERLLPLLLNSADQSQRAAGLLLQSVGTGGEGDAAAAPNPQARDALAQMALGTQSPHIYAWALRSCQGLRGEGMCQLLSAEQWARLEPANAIAWLQVGVDAQARRDPAAVAEALYRVSHASRVDMRWGTLTGVALSRAPTDLPPIARAAIADEVMAVEAGLALPHLIATQHCQVADVRDANRRQVCAAVAEVFHDKGSTLVDLGIAATLGQRVGWPAERVQALHDERDAIQQLYAQRNGPSRWGCAAVEQRIRHGADIGRLGELAVMRRALKESPDGVAVLAHRQREVLARRAAASASAAAASAAGV